MVKLKDLFEIEPKKEISQEEILPEEPKIISKSITKEEKRLIKSNLIPSAKLNLLKYLYAELTGKSTTNKIKKSMKKAVIEEISKF